MRISKGKVIGAIIVCFFLTYALSTFNIDSVSIICKWLYNRMYYLVPVLLIIISLQSGLFYLSENLVKCFQLIAVLIICSLGYMAFSRIPNTELIQQIIYLLYPVLIASIMIDNMIFEELYYTIVLLLFVSIFGYFNEIGGLSSLTIENIKLISFADSYSPFESHMFSGLAMGFSAFFCYYNKNKIFTVISVIFCILTFKRMSIFFTIILLIVGLLKNVKEKAVNRKLLRVSCIVTVILTICYYILLNDDTNRILNLVSERLFNISIDELIMGRNWLFDALINNGFISSGLGSSLMYSDNIEMDLVRVLLEVGIVGLISLVVYLWYTSKRNIYLWTFMLSIIIGLLVSHSLTAFMGWILKYIVIYSIEKYPANIEICNYESVEKEAVGL